MIKSQDIKKGTCIRMDGKLYFCIDFLHVKPGKGNTIMRTTLKDVVSGRVLERRFNIGVALETWLGVNNLELGLHWHFSIENGFR